MMSAATGVSPAEYSAMFDTVYVSLYKYFGSPYGAILAGTEDFCRGLYHHRRMFGGGLSSAALAAALALEGVEGFEDRFAKAMLKASSLFAELNAIPGLTIGAYEHGSKSSFELAVRDRIGRASQTACRVSRICKRR